jgi:hypothetical protein
VAAQRTLGIEVSGINVFSFFSLIDIDHLSMVREQLRMAHDSASPVQLAPRFVRHLTKHCGSNGPWFARGISPHC